MTFVFIPSPLSHVTSRFEGHSCFPRPLDFPLLSLRRGRWQLAFLSLAHVLLFFFWIPPWTDQGGRMWWMLHERGDHIQAILVEPLKGQQTSRARNESCQRMCVCQSRFGGVSRSKQFARATRSGDGLVWFEGAVEEMPAGARCGGDGGHARAERCDCRVAPDAERKHPVKHCAASARGISQNKLTYTSP